MAKFYNSRVKTGRLAGSVFAIRNGETIERSYQPIVANPSTPAQVETRAKFKLLSQLGAVMASYIAIPREGAVSPRNLFARKNYENVLYTSDTASANLTAVQLTDSVVALPAVRAVVSENRLSLSLQSSVQDLSRVVYVAFVKTDDDKLRFFSSSVATEPGDTYAWGASIQYSASNSYVIYAYGIRINSDTARARFGNMVVESAESIAKLIVTRSVTGSDVTLTETRSLVFPAANQNNREDVIEEVTESKKKK